MPKLADGKSPKLCKDREYAYVRLNGKKCYLGKYGSPDATKAYHSLLNKFSDSPDILNILNTKKGNAFRLIQDLNQTEKSEHSATLEQLVADYLDGATG
jgi:hypothetical protein